MSGVQGVGDGVGYGFDGFEGFFKMIFWILLAVMALWSGVEFWVMGFARPSVSLSVFYGVMMGWAVVDLFRALLELYRFLLVSITESEEGEDFS